jgi:hypothetical protein
MIWAINSICAPNRGSKERQPLLSYLKVTQVQQQQQ